LLVAIRQSNRRAASKSKTLKRGLVVMRNSKNLDFPTLESVNRPTVNTGQAAHYLNLHCVTLRRWASAQTGAIKPVRVCGRLHWSVADIRRVLGVAA
jgi:hypothetical protein